MNPLAVDTSAESPRPTFSKRVTATDIARVLAEKLGMPLDIVAGHLSEGGGARMLQLESVLGQTTDEVLLIRYRHE